MGPENWTEIRISVEALGFREEDNNQDSRGGAIYWVLGVGPKAFHKNRNERASRLVIT